MRRVARFSVTPVKGLALHHPDEIDLGAGGVEDNRRFFFVHRNGRRVSGISHPTLVRVRADYERRSDQLGLTFPDGERVVGQVQLAGSTETDFYGRPVPGRYVDGPWGEAMSRYLGTDVRLVRAERPGDGADVEVATLVSRESVDELRRNGGRDDVDGRRFRMLVEIEGCERAHEEDAWNGREVRLGEAVLRVGGPVPRCAITTRDPDTGERDFDSLRVIKDYRGARDDGGKARLDFGVYATVARPGAVRVGDAVEPL